MDSGAPKIVDRSNFQAELDALRIREKAYTREGDAIAAARRRLSMVEVDLLAKPVWRRREISRRSFPCARLCAVRIFRFCRRLMICAAFCISGKLGQTVGVTVRSPC